MGELTVLSDSYNGRQIRLALKQDIDVAGCKSIISWTLISEGGSATYYDIAPTTVVLNGITVFNLPTVTEWNTNKFPAAKGSISGTIEVAHVKSTGEKTIQVTLKTNIYDHTAKTYSVKWSLDAIPRASSISSMNATTLGSPITVTIAKLDPAYTHNLRYQINDGNIVNIGSGIDTTATFTIPESQAVNCTNSTVAQLSLYLRTYMGSDLVGLVTTTYTIGIPPTVVPSVDVGITYNNEYQGMVLQNVSSANVSISAQGMYGASIVSCSTSLLGKTYNGTSITGIPITSVGNIAVTTTVVDSRGVQTIVTSNINATAYNKPSVVDIEAYRCNDDGTPNPSGTKVKLKARAVYTAVGSSYVCILRYMLGGVGQWTPIEDTVYDDVINGYFAVDKSYKLYVSALDSVGESTIYELDIATDHPTFVLGKGGDSIGMGGYPSHKGVDVLMDMYLSKDMYAVDSSGTAHPSDYIVEQGTNSMWTYRKWNSGVVECWGKKTASATLVASGNIYGYNPINTGLPAGLFTDILWADATVMSNKFKGIWTEINYFTNSVISIGVARAENLGVVENLTICIKLIGKWK